MTRPRHEIGPPRAAVGGFPYPGHRTMDKVMIAELKAAGEQCKLCQGQGLSYKVGTCPRCQNTGREPTRR